MRPTVSGEMLVTTPSVTSWRASSRQSHLARERPYSSGRSQAILTSCSATSGGKDRPPAGSGAVGQAREALGKEPLDPLAGVALRQTCGLGRLLQGHGGLLQQQQQSRPADQAAGQGGGTEPALQLGALAVGQAEDKGLLAATHGDTPGRGKSKARLDGPDCPTGAAAVN